ncbi:MAG: hypothetical protein AAF747_09885 [Planctomycetota bacterium]
MSTADQPKPTGGPKPTDGPKPGKPTEAKADAAPKQKRHARRLAARRPKPKRRRRLRPVAAVSALTRFAQGLVVLAVIVGVGVLSMEIARARVEREVYKTRLADLHLEFDALVERYNRAVRRSAVTELVVEDGELDVSVRSSAGELRRIETDADPSREVYVDFAVVNGRIWVRRVFDETTAPSDATLIDPELAEIDWESEEASHGQAVYRSLSEGRWVVSVSGSGAMQLVPSPIDGPADLVAPPRVASFEELEAEARREVGELGWIEMIRALLRG